MTKHEQFIRDYTRGNSNELVSGDYHEWITPDEALRACEIAQQELWHKASDGEYPAYDRDVIALQRMASGILKVVFAHRPNPNGYVVVSGEKLYAKTYDGWNLPDIAYWLDVELPKEIEE